MRALFAFWNRNSLARKMALPLILGSLLFALIMVYVVYNIQMKSVEEQAIEQAEGIIAQFVDTEATLAEQGLLKRHLVHQVSERLNKRGLMQLKLISPTPFDPNSAQVCMGERGPGLFGQQSTKCPDQPGDDRGRKSLVLYDADLCISRVLRRLP